MAAEAPTAAGSQTGQRRDGLWLLVLWIVLSIIGCLLVALVWGPHMPPGAQSSSAASQQTDITVLATIATPVVIGVLLYFGWALTFWRQKPGDETDAAPIHGNTGIQATWIIGTAAIVLALAVYGTVELDRPGGRGRRRGPAADLEAGLHHHRLGHLVDARHQQHPAGPGDRPAVGVDLPVPAVRRVRDHPADAAGGRAGAVQRHLAGRDPQLLGLPARREGRRQPGREQRRLHDAAAHRRLPGPLRRAVRHLARLDVRHRQGHAGVRLPELDADHEDAARRRDQAAAAVRDSPTTRPTIPAGQGQRRSSA